MGSVTENHEQAVCPKCEGNLDYNGEMTHADQNIGYEWTCLKCNIDGVEWYYLEFCEHIISKK